MSDEGAKELIELEVGDLLKDSALFFIKCVEEWRSL